MKKLGYIVIEPRYLRLISKVPFIEYTDVFPQEDGLPILIVGWNKVIELYPNQKITDHQISNNIFWTFTQHEKRTDYEKDLKNFYKVILNYLKSDLKYRYINIFHTKYSEIADLLDILQSDERVDVYLCYGRFLYAHHSKKVWGLNLDDCNFVGISKESIMNRLYHGSNNHVFYDTSFIPQEILQLIGTDRKLIPYLHSILENSIFVEK